MRLERPGNRQKQSQSHRIAESGEQPAQSAAPEQTAFTQGVFGSETHRCGTSEPDTSATRNPSPRRTRSGDGVLPLSSQDNGSIAERHRMILRRDARRGRGADDLIEHRAVKVVHFCVVVAGIRVAVAGQCIGLGLYEMPSESTVRVQPADVVPGHFVHTYNFPRTHADIATEDREIDVLPFSSVAMPLNKGFAIHGSSGGVTDLPGAHDLMGGVFRPAPGPWCVESEAGRLVRAALSRLRVHAGRTRLGGEQRSEYSRTQNRPDALNRNF